MIFTVTDGGSQSEPFDSETIEVVDGNIGVLLMINPGGDPERRTIQQVILLKDANGTFAYAQVLPDGLMGTSSPGLI
jgi:hypothetical protein